MTTNKKARIYYGNEENAFEIEVTEFKSLEDAKKEFPVAVDNNAQTAIHIGEDEHGYTEIYTLAVAGNYREARKPLVRARQEIVALFR